MWTCASQASTLSIRGFERVGPREPRCGVNPVRELRYPAFGGRDGPVHDHHWRTLRCRSNAPSGMAAATGLHSDGSGTFNRECTAWLVFAPLTNVECSKPL